MTIPPVVAFKTFSPILRSLAVTPLLVAFVFCLSGCGKSEIATSTAVRLHPDNGRYFEFRGQPVVLVGSTEHYGSVINLDFNYVRYLDEVRAPAA